MALTREDFIRLLQERFPDVAGAIDDCSEGLLHPEMGAFSRASEEAIDAGDFDTLKKHFELAELLHKEGDSSINNAVNVSYLEHLEMYREEPNYERAFALMSPYLRNAWIEMYKHLDQVHGMTVIEDMKRLGRI